MGGYSKAGPAFDMVSTEKTADHFIFWNLHKILFIPVFYIFLNPSGMYCVWTRLGYTSLRATILRT